jgi:hypothetical protein
MEKTMNNVKIYILEDRRMEAHMIGEYVGVCWKIIPSNFFYDLIPDGDGYVKKQSMTRTGKPWIDFLWIRKDGSGEIYLDDDSPVDGGFHVDAARKIRTELEWAIAYCEAQDG